MSDDTTNPTLYAIDRKTVMDKAKCRAHIVASIKPLLAHTRCGLSLNFKDAVLTTDGGSCVCASCSPNPGPNLMSQLAHMVEENMKNERK